MIFWKLRGLKAKSWEAREEAVGRLAGSKDPRVVAAMAGALFDTAEPVVAAAAHALVASGEPGMAALLQALSESGRRDAGQAARRVASSLGSRRDLPVVERLADALDAQPAPLRREAVRLLARLVDPRRVSALEKALSDREDDVVIEAAEALSQAGTTAIPALTGALERGGPAARRSAARAMVRLGGPVVVDCLARALRDQDAEVRRVAARGLGQLADPTRLDALIEALRDSSSGVVQEAAVALGRFADPRAVDALVAAARGQTEPGANQAVIEALGKIADPRALGFLLQRLDYPDPRLVTEAALALGSFTDPRAADALIPKLDHAHATVRVAAARSLARIGNPMAITALTIALEKATRRALPEEKDLAAAVAQLQGP